MKDPRIVEFSGKGKGVVANRRFSIDDVVHELSFIGFRPRLGATESAIQIWGEFFIDCDGDLVDDYINHSCNPNVMIRLSSYDFVAIRNILEGEEITYNYLTTEYDLAVEGLDFDCMCERENCFGRIKGFKYLTREQQESLWLYLSPFLRLKMCYPESVRLDEVFKL